MAGEIETLLNIKEQATREQQALAASLEIRGAELQAALATMERYNREVTQRNEMGELLKTCIGIAEAGAVIARFAPPIWARWARKRWWQCRTGVRRLPQSR